jgi:hypothetical protein
LLDIAKDKEDNLDKTARDNKPSLDKTEAGVGSRDKTPALDKIAVPKKDNPK